MQSMPASRAARMHRLFRYRVSKLSPGAVEPVAVFDAHVLGPEHERGHPRVRGGDLLDVAEARRSARSPRRSRSAPRAGRGAARPRRSELRDRSDVLGPWTLGISSACGAACDDHLDVALGLLGGRGIDPHPDLAAVPVDLSQRRQRRLARGDLLMRAGTPSSSSMWTMSVPRRAPPSRADRAGARG